MSELTVVLDRKNMAVRVESGSMVIDQPGCAPTKVPLNMIGGVTVVGSPMVSCGVWRELAARGVSAVVVPARGKGEPAYIGNGLSGSVVRRLSQYRAALDLGYRLNIGHFILERKLRGQEENLAALERTDGELDPHIEKIFELRKQLCEAESETTLMGLEGMAAHHYFQALREIFSEPWSFEGRNRRPPKDPLNSLLSLGYVMAASEVRKAIFQKGMDPALGFLHAAKNGRESFVLDVLETVRPRMDRFAFQLLSGPMRVSHFSSSEKDGCLLGKAGRKIFFQCWGAWNAADADEPAVRDLASEALEKILSMEPFKTDRIAEEIFREEDPPDWM